MFSKRAPPLPPRFFLMLSKHLHVLVLCGLWGPCLLPSAVLHNFSPTSSPPCCFLARRFFFLCHHDHVFVVPQRKGPNPLHNFLRLSPFRSNKRSNHVGFCGLLPSSGHLFHWCRVRAAITTKDQLIPLKGRASSRSFPSSIQ